MFVQLICKITSCKIIFRLDKLNLIKTGISSTGTRERILLLEFVPGLMSVIQHKCL